MEQQLLKGKDIGMLFLFIWLLTGADGVRYRGMLENKFLRGPPVPPGVRYPSEQWFTQKLDHFNPTDERTWLQRFYTNDTFYTPGGPVFLMLGGEGPIGVGWMLSGQWIENAQIHGALCFQVEHRFYGVSHPTTDLTLGNIEYLSSEQALADLAYFIATMNKEKNLSGSKWIMFGGSYPGSLAAWMRLKYPHLVYGSVSSSGPLQAEADFKEYMEVVQNSMATAGEDCVTEVKQATQQISTLLGEGRTQGDINKMFSLCYQLNTSNANDVSVFYESLANNWASIVQYDPFNARMEEPRASLGINAACAVMTKNDGRTSIERYASLNTLIMQSLGESCLYNLYSGTINYYKDTAWGNENSMARQWMYQTCSEFGFYQTSDSSAQPFGNAFPLSFFVQQCMDIFGRKFNNQFLDSTVERTNMFYGGTGIKASRIIFVQGSIDPWHALGVTKTSLPDSIAIYINGTSHCADMMPSYSTDPPQLVAAHQEIREELNKWLQ